MKKGFRVVGLVALAFAIAHCGDSDVRVSTGPGVVPAPGTFTGSLSDGGAIRIEVGSIEEVSFDCDDEVITETFTPPREIENDGSFEVNFSDGGREFRVAGTFRDNNTVDGSINDEDNECDVSFDATRGGVVPTPVATPTSVVGPSETAVVATATPNEGPTATPDDGPTETPVDGATQTPGGPTQTPGPGATRTATPGPAGSPCPVAGEVVSNAGAQEVLDTGWTGLAHDQTVIQDGKLTFTVSGCASATRPCGVCQVGGPIQNLKADQGDINARRCSGDTSIKCADNSACTGKGSCVFFFGAPLPLSAGGVSTCVTNQISGNVTGTANIETGAFASALNLTSRVYNALELAVPCPVCSGDATVNDGNAAGTCSGGPRQGQACDGNGRSPKFQSFGTTSFDCPPNPGALITALSFSLDGSSGTETMTLTAGSPGCSAAAGKKCFCPSDSQATAPNACIDDTSVAGDGTLCAADSPTQGHCPEGPVDTVCTIESFRGCLGDSDCPASGDSCGSAPRLCYLDNGVVGGSVSAFGMADPPTNGEADPTFAALFCVGKTNAAVNAAAGLPGLGRIELPLHTKEILTIP